MNDHDTAPVTLRSPPSSGLRLRAVPPVAMLTAADVARAELRASLARSIAKGRAALLRVRQ